MLNKTVLQKRLEQLFANPASSAEKGATDWADAYYTYAKYAQSCQGLGPAIGAPEAAKEVLSRMLLATYKIPGGDAISTAKKISIAISSYWLMPPMPFLGGIPGLVTVAIPATLEAALISTMAAMTPLTVSGKITTQEQANMWATVLDSWTRTVIVAHGLSCAAPIQ